MSCGVGCRCGSDLVLLWLWHRPAAVAPMRPLAWGKPPYTTGAALKREKKKKKPLKVDTPITLIEDFKDFIVFFYSTGLNWGQHHPLPLNRGTCGSICRQFWLWGCGGGDLPLEVEANDAAQHLTEHRTISQNQKFSKKLLPSSKLKFGKVSNVTYLLSCHKANKIGRAGIQTQPRLVSQVCVLYLT